MSELETIINTPSTDPFTAAALSSPYAGGTGARSYGPPVPLPPQRDRSTLPIEEMTDAELTLAHRFNYSAVAARREAVEKEYNRRVRRPGLEKMLQGPATS